VRCITLVWFEKVHIAYRCFSFFHSCTFWWSEVRTRNISKPVRSCTNSKSLETDEQAVVTEARVLLDGRRNCLTARTEDPESYVNASVHDEHQLIGGRRGGQGQ